MSFVATAVVATAAVSAYGTYKAGQAQKKAGKKQKKADRLQSFQNQMQQLRDYQLAVAQAGTAWAGSGASLESSGAMGARAAAGSQVANNIAMLGRGAHLAEGYNKAMGDANRWNTISSIAGTVSSTIGSISTVMPQNTPDNFVNLPGNNSVPSGGMRVPARAPVPGGMSS